MSDHTFKSAFRFYPRELALQALPRGLPTGWVSTWVLDLPPCSFALFSSLFSSFSFIRVCLPVSHGWTKRHQRGSYWQHQQILANFAATWHWPGPSGWLFGSVAFLALENSSTAPELHIRWKRKTCGAPGPPMPFRETGKPWRSQPRLGEHNFDIIKSCISIDIWLVTCKISNSTWPQTKFKAHLGGQNLNQ